MNIKPSRPRADLPTIILHWGLVICLLLSISTGLRIAMKSEDNVWMKWVEVLLLQGNVERWHFISAAILTALVLAYLAFLLKGGLAGRLKLRLAALGSPDRATRWQAINKIIYWMAFALLLGAALTGVILYFFGGALPAEAVALVHQILAWGFVAYIVLHIVAQLVLGGLRQLFKIVTPRLAYGMAAITALLIGASGAAIAYFGDSSRIQQLEIAKTDTAPVLDGDANDALWQKAPQAVVHTSRGFGLEGGEVDVKVRALHDSEYAYFLFQWKDATRSQKHIPLIKTAQGWKLMQTAYSKNDENDYYEDKFAVMLAPSPIAGGNTVHLGPKPLSDKSGPTNGLGLHYTTDGSLADVWHWKSVRSDATHQFDDNYFGAPMEEKKGKRYTGGYNQDPKTGGGFEQMWEKIKDSDLVTVKFLPKDLAATQAAMGKIDPNPNAGDSGIFSIKKSDTVAYSAELDTQIPLGTVIPSVLVDQPFAGDRGDVTVYSKWQDGIWTLEARRKLDTGSKFDQPIASGMYMWLAVFDHNQVRHTRHIHPLRLNLQN